MIRFLFLLVFLFPTAINAQIFNLPEVVFEQKVSKKLIAADCLNFKFKMSHLDDVDFYLASQLKETDKLTSLEKDVAFLTLLEDFSQELKDKEADISMKILKCTAIKDEGENASLPDLCIFLMAIQNHRKELALKQENFIIYAFNKHAEFSDFEKAHYLNKIQTLNDQDKLIERKK